MLTSTIVILAGLGSIMDDLSQPGISRELARHRAERLSEIQYELSLTLDKGAESASGIVQVRFHLEDAESPLILDFAGSAIESLQINGEPVEAIERVANHIVLPKERLKEGENACHLRFETPIAASGTPLTVYHDAAADQDFFYTLVVPADAHRLFPCFDQPDLKAAFAVELNTPESWQAVANGPLESIAQSSDSPGRKIWSFGATRPISTYLMAFAAGPFDRIDDDASDLTLYVRPSKRKDTKPAEIFALHRQALKEMTAYFGQPYPFEKLDLVLAPGFPYGGMEHAGAIFYRETSLAFDHEPSDRELLGRSTLIFHEVAHQWFGNLVTMEWFDDLWLKEGFATFIAYRTLSKLRPDLSPWLRFHQSVKPRATAVDATRGTTPVYQQLSNLADAKSAYGAIVYNKAPAILRHLEYVLGEETFRSGVARFLREHAYANATWRDLIAAFEKAAERDLSVWAKAWIETPGMPQVSVDWGVDEDGQLENVRLRQRSVQGDDRLWPIASRALLLLEDGDEVLVDLTSDKREKVLAELEGGSAPILIFPNADDFAYGSFVLDARSRDEARERLPKIEDPFLRMLLVTSLWETVRAAELAPVDHLSLLMQLLEGVERDPLTIDILLGQARTALWRYCSPEQRAQESPKLTAWIRGRMTAQETPDAVRLTLFRAWPGFPLSSSDIALAEELLSNEVKLPGIEISQRDRWSLVGALVEQRHPRAAALLAAEREADDGVDAERYAYIAGAGLATAENKAHYFETYLQPEEPPEQWVASSLSAFNAPGQEELTLPYLSRALGRAEWVKANRKIFFMPSWLDAFVNGHDSPEALKIVEAFLGRDDLPGDIRLKLLQSVDGLERAVRICEKFAR
ncbi:MAG: M1 family aminopeptidase [Planctomycetota bacterium]